MIPVIGQTYDTLRGQFTVMDWLPRSEAVLLCRADLRYLLAAQSDWHSWAPVLIVPISGEI
jgi:hypothetical protein